MRLRNDTMSLEEKVSSVVGSASMPFAFPPRNMSQFGEDTLLIDGGSTWNNNMISGIADCKQMGFKAEDIVVDIIILSGAHIDKDTNVTSSQNSMDDILPPTISNFFRKREIAQYYRLINDVVEFKNTHPRIHYRYFFNPDQQLLPFRDILDFDYSKTGPMIE